MSSILLSDFELLVSEWLQLLGTLDIDEVADPKVEASEILETLSLKLEKTIEKKRERASKILNARQFELYDAMIYAFCAQVDEEMLSHEGRLNGTSSDSVDLQSLWLAKLLEQRVFGSRNAGWSLPKSIRDLAAKVNCSDEELELAKAYLWVLNFGFGSTNLKPSAELASVRRELVNTLTREDPDNLKVGEHNYGKVPHSSESLQRLAPFGRWRTLFLRTVATLALITLLSYSVLSIWLRNELQL